MRLVSKWRARGLDCVLVDPREAVRCIRDVALARLDVLPTLDGIEPGLLELLWLERRGATVLNPVSVLLTAHDKLRTAAALERAQLPHPATRHLSPRETATPPSPPVVLKPRFGSWGRDVRLCRTDREVVAALSEFRSRPWFRRHGVLVQAELPTPGYDLRLLVAGGRVVGAVERQPQPGEWRTNVSVGARRLPTVPEAEARALAVAAADAIGSDLVGVDLMPLPDGGYSVLELNGAAEFDESYAQDGDVYTALAEALGLAAAGEVLRERRRKRAGSHTS